MTPEVGFEESAVSLSERRVVEARRALGAGDARKARRLLQPLLEQRGADPSFACLFADAALGDAAPEMALDAARRALSADGLAEEQRGGLLMRAAQALLILGRAEEALLASLEAVEASPRDRAAAEVFGHALVVNRRFDQALMVFRDVIEGQVHPSFRACMGMIKALDGAGFPDAAVEFGDACRGLFPRQPHIDLELARIESRKDPAVATDRLLALSAEMRETPEVLVTLGRLALQRHRDEEAREWFARARRLRPDDPFLRHLAEADAARAADDYVSRLFDGYAAGFEASLIALGYRVPGLVLRAIEAHHAGFRETGRVDRLLDLGCGTGLVGVMLHDCAGPDFVGVDLSEGMLREAREKGVYSELVRAEIGEFLARADRRWSVVVAADVFCYLGDLRDVVSSCRERLDDGGLLIFSVEKSEGDGPGWAKGATGRYAHSPAYVQGLLDGFDILQWDETALRWDRGAPVEGIFVVARRRGE